MQRGKDVWRHSPFRKIILPSLEGRVIACGGRIGVPLSG